MSGEGRHQVDAFSAERHGTRILPSWYLKTCAFSASCRLLTAPVSDPRPTSSHPGIVYPAAALGVIYDPRTGRQSYHEGHRGDIISLTVSSCRRFAASGDAASPPRVHVWDAVTGAGESEAPAALFACVVDSPPP